MIIQKYLVIKSNGSAKVVEREPRLERNEISLRLSLEIPNALFERPRLEATMKIPTEAIPKIKITPTVSDNVEKLIRQSTGLNMHVTVIEHEAEEKNK